MQKKCLQKWHQENNRKHVIKYLLFCILKAVRARLVQSKIRKIVKLLLDEKELSLLEGNLNKFPNS